MKTSKFDDLNDAFNVETDIVPTKTTKVQKKEVKSNGDHIQKDYEYTRGNLYSIIEKGQEAINGILELAQESEMPRAYEVAGQLIKSVSDATDKLMDLQKKLKDVNKEEEAKGHLQLTMLCLLDQHLSYQRYSSLDLIKRINKTGRGIPK